MTKKIVISDVDQVVVPAVHDARIRGFLLLANKKLLIPVEASDGARYCFVLHDVERLRADNFMEGNIVLDITVSIASAVEMSDIAYAYGINRMDNSLLIKTLDCLTQEKKIIVKINPSFGCMAVFICRSIEVEEDMLPQ